MTKPQTIALLLLSIFAIACLPGPVNLTPDVLPTITEHQKPSGTLPGSEVNTPDPAKTSVQPQGIQIKSQISEPQAGTPTTVYMPYIQSSTATPVPGQSLVADDTVISQFSTIPSTFVSIAASKNVLFMRQSTGGIIEFLGLDCLAGLRNDPQDYPAECITYSQSPYYYDNRKWDWNLWPDPMADAPAKVDQFVSYVAGHQSGYEVIGMKFCYVDGWNQDFSYYKEKMLQLESTYPMKVFIWSTSALWADPGDACNSAFNSCENIADFNSQLRTYARANNKPLYDIAAIESEGGNCLVEGYEGMCSKYYSDGGGHPNSEGSIHLAKGFWWLIARLSGWTP